MTTIQEMFKIGMDRHIPNLQYWPGKKLVELNLTVALDLPDWDAEDDPIPFADGTVSAIHAYHFLEHVSNPAEVLLECQRVLVPGGLVNIVVPYYSSQMQAQNLDHKNVFCEETWRVLFSNPYYDKNRTNWEFEIGMNIIIGIKENNLCLMTQLIRQ